MAPKETIKPVTKVHRTVKEMPSSAKGRASPIGAIKKPALVKKTVEKTTLKVSNTKTELSSIRRRTSTVPRVATPKPKENKATAIPSSVNKNAKVLSARKRRPMAAHSGVPIPDKLRKLLEKQALLQTAASVQSC